MKTKKNFSPIVSHYKSFFADTFLKFISINRNIENSFYPVSYTHLTLPTTVPV